ncbi:MAG: hypothetical protein EA398_16495 [Deltaproteobacteria bacterium]|nr:MAG: hypothetical protein EA398_16495 [Deltaproteobacteria bacterium]
MPGSSDVRFGGRSPHNGEETADMREPAGPTTGRSAGHGWVAVVACLCLIWTAAGCGGSDPQDLTDIPSERSGDETRPGTLDDPTGIPDLAAAGPWAVGHRTLRAQVAEERQLAVEVWYPAASAEGSRTALSAMEADARAGALAALLADAPEDCLRNTLGAVRGTRVASGRFPVVLYSHCHVCTRWSGAAMAERLASHGVVVLAPDHEGNTLWDQLEENAASVGEAFLRVRADDLHALLAILRGQADSTQRLLDDPAELDDLLTAMDPERMATLGHSFGAATAGLVLQEDPELRGAFAVAAPMENPLTPGVRMADLGERPVGFLLAVEDNSITTFGNTFLRDNAASALGPSVLVEVDDLGHWGMSDIVSLLPMFEPGCGDGRRMTNRRDFTYLPPDAGRDIAATAVAAFLVPLLTGADLGAAWDALDAREGVQVTRR